MKHLIIAGIIALAAFSSCRRDCESAEVICGEPLGSFTTIIMDDTASVCDLPRTYYIKTWDQAGNVPYDLIDWDVPDEAFDVWIRPDLMMVEFKVMEGTHILKVRGRALSQGLDWSEWNEKTWTLTLE